MLRLVSSLASWCFRIYNLECEDDIGHTARAKLGNACLLKSARTKKESEDNKPQHTGRQPSHFKCRLLQNTHARAT
jgi:hypothetical protein